MQVSRQAALVALGCATFAALHFFTPALRSTSVTTPAEPSDAKEEITAVKYVVNEGDVTKQVFCGMDGDKVTFAGMITTTKGNEDVTTETFMSRVGPGNGNYGVGSYDLGDNTELTTRVMGTNKLIAAFEYSATGDFQNAQTKPSCTYLTNNAVGTEYYFSKAAAQQLVDGLKALVTSIRNAFPWSSSTAPQKTL